MKKDTLIKTHTANKEFSFQTSMLIRDYIVENFMFGDDEGLEEKTSFQEGGIIDSTGILELVNFLEEQFRIAIADEELIPQNFDSIQSVVSFLDQKCSDANLTP
jgi:acyl carrier protein